VGLIAMRAFSLSIALALAACGPPEPVGQAFGPPLIPRSALFADAVRSAGKISPDGKWLGYIAPADGALNIWIAKREAPGETKPITRATGSGIQNFLFALDNRHVLYAQDADGDENTRIYATDLTTGEATPLTPKGARADIDNISPKHPSEILVTLNDRDTAYFDPVRINIQTGATKRLERNTQFSGFVTDADFALRYASRQTEDGGKEWFVRDGTQWRSWATVPPEDAVLTGLGTITTDGKTLNLVDTRNRDRAAQVAIDTANGAAHVLYEDPRADVGEVLKHPVTGKVQAVAARHLAKRWHVIDPEVAPDIAALQTLAKDGEFSVDARTQDDQTWIVRIGSSQTPERFYIYDRTSRRASLWFETEPDWAKRTVAVTHPLEIASRDGLRLPSYYLLPPTTDSDGDGTPATPLPMVLRVHGGPWDRDDDRFNGLNQWLANRGYAVLAVNFRGSTGFGKSFVNAGDREWGGKMLDDLVDAVAWAEQHKIAAPGKTVILGASYGGYAALAALTMRPTTFACGVAVAAPSNLETLIATIPPYWASTRRLYTTRVGDPDTADGRALLKARSPLMHIDALTRPLLIGQGATDPRVKQSEADQIVQALRIKGRPVTYVLFPDEGHGFAKPANAIAFSAVTEAFLAKCLGGRAEPVADDLRASSITIPIGANVLPEIATALNERAAHR
jgi:dipeptidyl aminopeptidase/acylaminoacyl peptidase